MVPLINKKPSTVIVPLTAFLTSQPHLYGKAAFEKVGVRVMSIWWSRGESNPRPKVLPRGLLRAQRVLFIPSSERGRSHSRSR